MNFIIRPQTYSDTPSIDALMEAAFGPTRSERTVNKMRAGVDPLPDLSFVAVGAQDQIVGSIRFWPLFLPQGSTFPLLGPLAVDPALRGAGIGRGLVQKGIDQARDQEWPAIFIVGDPGYYAPFGFKAELVSGLTLPGPVSPLTFMAMSFFDDVTLNGVPGVVTTRNSSDILI